MDKRDPEQPTSKPENFLEVSNLHKHFSLGEKNLKVLTGLNLSIDNSEMVAIMGPSGSGKTTLLNCICGIDLPDQGNIRIEGKLIDLQSESQRTLLRRNRIAIVFQFFNLIPTLNVEENITLPFFIAQTKQKNLNAKVQSMMEAVGLQHRKTHFPHQLSGGEMQLVSIARALVRCPSLLLADEPTGNVNPHIGRSIMDILRTTAKQQGTSVLMVTHSPEHAAWADRICFLNDGKIQDEYNHNGEISDLSPIYQRLLSLGI